MSKPQARGVRRIIKASGYSWLGIKQAFKGEAAFREEIYAAALMIPLACWLDVGVVERILLIASVLFVLIVELINSAIEAAIDRIGVEHHPLSGQAKDMGSAAVFFALIITLVTWGGILQAYWLA